MKKEDWIWMPHAAHLIIAKNCQFHLATWVGNYIVSTVGEYLPDAPVREIIVQSRGIKLNGIGDERLRDYMEKVGFEDLGYERKYETMVFESKPQKPEYACCPYTAKRFLELDMNGYNDPIEAFRGHQIMCEEWSKKDRPPKNIEESESK